MTILGVGGEEARAIATEIVDRWSRGEGPLHEAITAAILSAESRARPQWQPIETYVPKEGETILLSDGKIVGEAHWDDLAGMFYWANTSAGDYVDGEARGMTHWQPLPAPPDLARLSHPIPESDGC